MRFEQFQDQAAHLVGVGVQRHRQQDLDQPERIGVGDVAHRLGDELRIRNNHGGAVAHLDFGGPHVYAPDVALNAAQRHPVADLDRLFGQHDDARDKVLHHRLQAETDAHRQGAGHPRNPLQPDADGGQAQRQRQQVAGIGKQRGRPDLHAGIERGGRQEMLLQPAPDDAHHHQAQDDDQRGLQHRRRQYLEFANRNPLVQLVGALEQLGRPLAERRQQQHQRQGHHQQPAHARQQHGRLRPHFNEAGFRHVGGRSSIRRGGSTGGTGLGTQQRAEAIVDQHRQQVGRAEHDGNPGHLVHHEAAQRHIAQQQRHQADGHAQPGQADHRGQPQRAWRPVRG